MFGRHDGNIKGKKNHFLGRRTLGIQDADRHMGTSVSLVKQL
jgi:hypothetical protein